MKTDGSGVKIEKIIGVSGLVFGLLFFAVIRGAERRGQRTSSGPSLVAASGTSRVPQSKETPKWNEAYGKLPLSFEENQGQTAREVRYVSHGGGYELFLTPQEAVLALRPKASHDLSPLHRTATLRALRKERRAGQLTAIRMHLEGANPQAQISGVDRLPGKTNYFIGNDPKKWHTDVPSFARVKYASVYPGVDLVFYGNQRRLEYDFVVAPGTDPSTIKLKIDGARKMRINSQGDLILSVSGGEVELQKPLIYQQVKGERRKIAGNYRISGNHHVAFSVAAYDRSTPLILDPVLNYSTFLGGTADDGGSAIVVDGSGNAYIAGVTVSTDFPAGAKGAVSSAPAGNLDAAFVAELDPTGANLLYSTYLAGTITNFFEGAFGIDLDPSGKVYVTGVTFATDFPTTSANALNAGPLVANANGTVFLTKLDPTVSGVNSLIYSTYVAGTGGDFANTVAADAAGNAYIAGLTDSTDFPTMNPFQSSPSNSSGTAFLTRIDTTKAGNASLIYSTYLGGNGVNQATKLAYGDQGWGVAADSSGNAYIAGTTSSTDSSFIATATAYQTAPPTSNTTSSAFLSKIDTTKSGPGSLVYSTYLAGSVEDIGFAIALGPNNVAYLTGSTDSTDFPFPGATAGSFNTSGSVTGSAFLTLVDTTKSGTNSVKYSTFLAGTLGSQTGFGIRVDGSGIAYIAGTSASSSVAGTSSLKKLGAFQPTLSNTLGNAFISKLNPAGTGATDLLYATYFGGNGNNNASADQAFGIAIDSANPPNAYITGETESTDLPIFPNPGAFQAKLNGTGTATAFDAYVAKLSLIPTLSIVPSSLNFGTQPVGVTSGAQTVTVTNNNNVTVNFSSIAITGANSADFAKSADTCGASVVAGAQCTVSVTFKPAAAVGLEAATLVFTDDDVNSPQSVSLSGTGSASAPGVGFAPANLAFGGQLLTTTSAAKTVTLTNTGTGALTINTITVAGSSDFVAVSTGAGACPIGPATLAAGANCTISVTFAPSALGARAGTLTVTDNAGGSPHTLALTGTGWDFTVAATTPAAVTAGNSANFTVTMTPLGGFNQAVTLACTGAPKLATCTPAPTSLTAADGATPQTSTVTVTTTALFVPPSRVPTPPPSMRQIVPLVLALMLLSLLITTRRLRTRLGIVTTILFLVGLAGCSGPKPPGTPAGQSTLTITATSGGVNKTVQVTLTVN